MIDEVDQTLLKLLADDGRHSWTTLGSAVGLSADAVRVRVEKLISDGVCEPSTLIDPVVFGYHSRAVMGIKLLGDPTEFLKWSRNQYGIVHLVRVAGEYTYFADILGPSLVELHSMANEQLGSLPGIQHVEMLPTIKVLKWRSDTKPNWVAESNPEQLKDDDDAILRALVNYPRIGLAELAEKLDRPYAPLRRRVRTLYKSGVVRTTFVIDDALAHESVSALLLVPYQAGLDRVRDALASYSEVTILLESAGRFALNGEAMSSSLSELRDVAVKLSNDVGGVVEVQPYVHVEKLPGFPSFNSANL